MLSFYLLNCYINAFTIMLPLILRHHIFKLSKTYDSLGLNHHSCFKLKIFPTSFLLPPLPPTTSLEVKGLWFIFLYLVLFESYTVTSNSRNASIAGDSHKAHSYLGHHLQVQSLSLNKISVCLPIAFTHVLPPLHSTEHMQLLCSLTALQRKS